MWYTKEVSDVFKELKSSEQGLTNKEVIKRQKKYGLNTLPKSKKNGLIKTFFMQFASPIIGILIFAIILSLIIGEYIDAIFITAVITINAILGTVQEYTAEKGAEKLQDMIKVRVKVKRNGIQTEVDASELVVGDIVLFESGDKIPADIRIIEASNFTVDESMLTGESEARTKEVVILNEETELADRINMLYAGTIAMSGRVVGVVVETGLSTEIGKIADKVLNTEDADSPLVIRIVKFSKQLSITFGIFALFLSLILYYKGYMIKEIFFSVIALTVSAIPEGLSTAMTIALSISSSRMAKKNVIVKKLSSVESLGSCTVIASDKTGTLTVNEQTAKTIMLPWGDSFYIKGAGYSPNEKITFTNEENKNNIKLISKIAKFGVLNNEADLKFDNERWISSGDSIDIAFLTLGEKLGINKKTLKDNQIIARIPYESKQKYSAVYFKDEFDGVNYFTVKGSVEKVLSFCKKSATKVGTQKIDKEKILKQNKEMALNGYRVIAIAYGKKDRLVSKPSYDEKDLPDLTFVGLVGFVDPIKEDTIEAVEACKNAGIKIYMITGDHPLTAYFIGKKLNIISDFLEVTTGEEINKKMALGDNAFDEFIKSVKICARTTPMQKLAIVESLKRQGEFVAVTGDGVNDAPALKSANIGVAMGSGSDVAKETGDMIIADDNFSTIVTGVKEGRKAYNNIRNVIYLLLSTGFSEIILYVLSIICNMPIPLTAIQFLWLNLITNGIQGDALAFEKNDINIMKEKVRNTKEGIFNKLLLSEIIISAVTIAIITFSVYHYLYNIMGIDVVLARTYVMIIMVFMENIHIFNCRSEYTSLLKVRVKDNLFVIITLTIANIIQVLIVRFEAVAKVFELTTMPTAQAICLILYTIPLLIIMEFFKLYINRSKEKTS